MLQRMLSMSLTFVVVASPAEAKLDKELADQVYSVLERANRSGDAVTRALATEAFGSLRPADTKPYAIDALKDPVYGVRAAAIKALIRIKDKAYEPVLYNELANPKRDWDRELMPILAMLDDKQAVALGHKLIADERATTRNEAIAAFGRLGGPRMMAFFKPLVTHKDLPLAEGVQGYILTLRTKEVLPLYQLVLKVGTPKMQQRALESLAEFEKGTNMPFVRGLLKSKDPELQTRAAEVLAHHGDRSAVKALLPNLMKDEKTVIRTLQALSKVPGKDLYPGCASFLRRKDTNPDILRLCFEIHYRTKNLGIVDTLRKYRRNDNLRTQAVAVFYLGVIEGGRALPTLHEDLFHGDPFVRKAAIQAVGRIGSRESIDHLGRVLDQSRDPEIRIEVVKALAGIKDKAIVRVLSFLITDPTPEVRRWAIVGLTRVRHTDAVSSLKIATHDGNIATRGEAVKAIMLLDKTEGITAFRVALGWLPAERVHELAREMGDRFLPYADMALTSTRAEVRAAAMQVLEKYPKQEENVLTRALERTRDNDLKISILERFAKRNGKTELERMAQFADAREQPVKVAALRLLGELGDPNGADAVLRKALFDSDERSRVTAAISLLNLHQKKKRRRGKRRRGRK